MRRLRYHVAMSLDGFIAGPNGEYDWIVQDPTVDFGELFRQFDTALIGRLTYEVMLKAGQPPASLGMEAFVVSNTLNPAEHPGITILSSGVAEAVARLKARPGAENAAGNEKDIWLFGGGQLFRSLLDAGLVDTVEVAVIPVLLGGGIPLLPAGSSRGLRLYDSKILPSGIVMLHYSVSPVA